jgi:O-antigen/teichoic acid export membrane protein
MAFVIAIAVVAVMMSFGPWFLTRWTGGHVPPSRPLLSILLMVVVLYSLWSTSSTLLTATNQHQKLSVYYLFGTGITVVFTYFLARQFGLYGAAASLLISEAVMNTYVLPASIRLSEDTFAGFVSSMFTVPPSLRPQVLLARFARSKPGLES